MRKHTPDEKRKYGRVGSYSSKYDTKYADHDVYFTKSMGVGRTFKPLYVYFKPNNFYTPKGYLSPTYNQTYYDGYGYNFFT